MTRQELAALFRFSRRERTGIIVLVVLVTGAWAIPYFFTEKVTDAPEEFIEWIGSIDSTRHQKDENHVIPDERVTGSVPGTLFYFDPNTLAAEQWQKLGLSPKTISTILKYRAKGGVFRKKEDFSRIYGLNEKEYLRLAPYIRLPEYRMKDRAGNIPFRFQDAGNGWTRQTSGMAPARIEINAADSSEWTRLPGIGPVLASRILRFRQQLGGFYSLEQVRELYGLTDSVYQLILPFLHLEDPPAYRKIDLNSVDEETLRQHPYVRHTLARRIITYRNMHGPFKNPEDLRNIAGVSDVIYHKLEPYCQIY
jgi:DNA uptake protein ComE-like DNA-binding protein